MNLVFRDVLMCSSNMKWKELVILLDAEDTLPQEDVTAGSVDVVVTRVTGVDHQPVDEFHGLSPLTTQLAGNDNLATLGAALHDETEHTVAGPEKRNAH